MVHQLRLHIVILHVMLAGELVQLLCFFCGDLSHDSWYCFLYNPIRSQVVFITALLISTTAELIQTLFSSSRAPSPRPQFPKYIKVKNRMASLFRERKFFFPRSR